MGDYDDDEVPLVSVYRRAELPERYHWRDSRFVSPIVLVARPGAVLLTVRRARDATTAARFDHSICCRRKFRRQT